MLAQPTVAERTTTSNSARASVISSFLKRHVQVWRTSRAARLPPWLDLPAPAIGVVSGRMTSHDTR
jgi:hypothetical protein